MKENKELLKLLKEIRRESIICNPQSKYCRDWIPEAVVEYFSSFYSNKIFCDIGCGPGGVVFSAARFAKMSIGVEISSRAYLPEGSGCGRGVGDRMMKYAAREDTNVQLIYNFDAQNTKLPEADFYIMNMPFRAALEIVERLKKDSPQSMVLICSPSDGGGCAGLWQKNEGKNFLEKNSFNFFYYDKITGRSRIIAFKDFTGNVEIADKPKIIDNYKD